MPNQSAVPGASKRFLVIPEPRYGGPRTFYDNLREFLRMKGYDPAPGVEAGLDFLVVIVQAPLSSLLAAKRLGIPIALRLDGLYYPAKEGYFSRNYLINLKVWIIGTFFADLIIYQSKYSMDMCRALLGPSRKRHRIIYNGVPRRAAVGAPARPGAAGAVLRFVATGFFRGWEMLPATVQALDLCQGRFPFSLDVYGEVDKASRPFLDRPWLNHKGRLPNAAVVSRLPEYDALIFTQTNPPCPNTVVEAITAGIPVLGFRSGSLPELLEFNQELLADTPRRLFHRPADFSPEELARCILRFREGEGGFKERAWENRDMFCEAKTLDVYYASLAEMASR